MRMIDPLMTCAAMLAAHPPTQSTTKAALILAARADELLGGPVLCGATAATSVAHPLSADSRYLLIRVQHALVLEHANPADLTERGEQWYDALIALNTLGSDASPAQRVAVLALLLADAVVGAPADTLTVQGSRAYTVTLHDGHYTQGFTCTCKGYYANGAGQTLCKHVLAATVACQINGFYVT